MHDLQKAIKNAKQPLWSKQEAQTDAQQLWQGLHAITLYCLKTTISNDSDGSPQDKLNAFYTRFKRRAMMYLHKAAQSLTTL